MVLQSFVWPWPVFSFLILHRRQDSLDGGSARRKASTYRTQTQNKRIHTPNIHALSGIRTHDPSVRESENSSCFRPRGYRDRHFVSENCEQVHIYEL
jgi:hypothetical protein